MNPEWVEWFNGYLIGWTESNALETRSCRSNSTPSSRQSQNTKGTEQMTDWNALRDVVYKTAVDHGWHETKREFPEIACLIHSELSEALEELRKPGENDLYYAESGKPEGFYVEMADAIIRILDWMGDEKQDVQLMDVHDIVGACEADRISTVAVSHMAVSRSLESYLKGDLGGTVFWLNVTVTLIVAQLKAEGKSAEVFILAKNLWNQKREYRHGKKF